MQGNNTIALNEATMIEIVELYLNGRAKSLMEGSRVTSVKGNTESSQMIFIITVERKEKEKPA